MNNGFYYSVKSTCEVFLVLILNNHKINTASLILALRGTDSSSSLTKATTTTMTTSTTTT